MYVYTFQSIFINLRRDHLVMNKFNQIKKLLDYKYKL